MILELIRKEIKRCRQSRNRICEAAGIEPAALCRIMQGGSCKAETVDKLFKYFGLTIIKKPKRKAR